MFSECSSLQELDLSKFNTSKVTNMSGLFWGCLSLKELNIPDFNNNKYTTNIKGMFYGCLDELKDKITLLKSNLWCEEAFINIENQSYSYFEEF